MKTPNYAEFELPLDISKTPLALTGEELKRHLQNADVGHRPLYMDLRQIQSAKLLEQIIALLLASFSELKIHPHFPYPFFILCSPTLSFDTSPFSSFRSLEELPRHFKCQFKQFTPKEELAYNKMNIAYARADLADIEKGQREIQYIAEKQKKLHTLCCETAFFEEIISIIQKTKWVK